MTDERAERPDGAGPSPDGANRTEGADRASGTSPGDVTSRADGPNGGSGPSDGGSAAPAPDPRAASPGEGARRDDHDHTPPAPAAAPGEAGAGSSKTPTPSAEGGSEAAETPQNGPAPGVGVDPAVPDDHSHTPPAHPHDSPDGGGDGGSGADGEAPSARDLKPEALSSDMEAEIDAAMSAMEGVGGGGGVSGAAPGGESARSGGGAAGAGAARPTQAEVMAADEKAHRSVRGPRVVESGREYREGVVVSVGPDDIFVEFGPKSLGVVPRQQFKDKSGAEPDLPSTGDTIKVAVDKYEPGESLYMCSRPGAVQKADWELLQPGQVVEARVTGKNKGGLELEVAGHRAFMPASQVSDARVEDLSVFVGEKMNCKVTKVDRSGRGNITLSRRDIIDQEKKERAAELKSSLNEGDVLEGKVKKTMPFGAFVDIGGIDGLVHISDLSHDRVRKTEDVVKEGNTVRVKVLKLDWEQGRHSLGMKQLQDDPFQVGLSEINEGDVISARVAKLTDFGAFLEVAPGIEGLCHISELDWRRVEKTSDAVQPDQVVNAKVLKIEEDSRRISLSIKQAKDRPEPRGGGGGRKGGRGDRDDRSPDEIKKETPALRRMREEAKKREKQKSGGGGLGDVGGMGMGLGDLKL